MKRRNDLKNTNETPGTFILGLLLEKLEAMSAIRYTTNGKVIIKRSDLNLATSHILHMNRERTADLLKAYDNVGLLKNGNRGIYLIEGGSDD